MKVIIILGFVAIAFSAAYSMTLPDISEEWNLFKTKFHKAYKDVEEELFRKNLYLENKIKIEEHNKLYKKGHVTYKLGMNQFGDMASDEISAEMNGFNQLLKNKNDDDESVNFLRPRNEDIPSSIDWRKKGAVTPVKNQLKCGSCWAFSSTGALEGQNFLKTGQLVSLSEQNLVDCSRRYGNKGCRGGLMDSSFEYIQANGGIDTEESYPYKAKTGLFCKYKSKNKGSTDTGFVDITSGDENALTVAVATVGPVSVAIDASSADFHFYESGVLYVPDCSSESLDHGVLAVGYNTTESGEDYWIVKNSWGSDWGQKGYVWMARNKDNNCGIATAASYPLV